MRASVVQLDRTIYDRDALEEAARVYAGEDAVTTVVTETADHLVVEIHSRVPAAADEFLNFALMASLERLFVRF